MGINSDLDPYVGIYKQQDLSGWKTMVKYPGHLGRISPSQPWFVVTSRPDGYSIPQLLLFYIQSGLNHLAAMPLVSGYSVLGVGRDMHTLVSFYTKAATLMSEFRVYIYKYHIYIIIIYIYGEFQLSTHLQVLVSGMYFSQLGSAFFRVM